jgi:hypothetical protein
MSNLRKAGATTSAACTDSSSTVCVEQCRNVGSRVWRDTRNVCGVAQHSELDILLFGQQQA